MRSLFIEPWEGEDGSGQGKGLGSLEKPESGLVWSVWSGFGRKEGFELSDLAWLMT